MANDAVRNQKVFITLESVLELQAEYMKTKARLNQTLEVSIARGVEEKVRVYERIIKMLNLPIAGPI